MNENSTNKFLLDQISCGQIQWEQLDNEIDLVRGFSQTLIK